MTTSNYASKQQVSIGGRARVLKFTLAGANWFREHTKSLGWGVDGAGLSLLRGGVGGKDYPLDEIMIPKLLVAFTCYEYLGREAKEPFDPEGLEQELINGIDEDNFVAVMEGVNAVMRKALGIKDKPVELDEDDAPADDEEDADPQVGEPPS